MSGSLTLQDVSSKTNISNMMFLRLSGWPGSLQGFKLSQLWHVPPLSSPSLPPLYSLVWGFLSKPRLNVRGVWQISHLSGLIFLTFNIWDIHSPAQLNISGHDFSTTLKCTPVQSHSLGAGGSASIHLAPWQPDQRCNKCALPASGGHRILSLFADKTLTKFYQGPQNKYGSRW